MKNTINTSAANININERNEYFKNLVANKEKNSIPYIVSHVAEKGVENIFYVSQNYRGLYEDDDCTFVYWDNNTGEIVNDFWGTNFAAPGFNLYTNNIITFGEALRAGMVNKELHTNYNIERFYSEINSIVKNNTIKDVFAKYYPLIKVEGGRKWKGMGYLLDKVETTDKYGYIKTEAKVLSLEDFQIHYCTYRYIQFVELDSIIEEYKNYAKSCVETCIKNNTLYLIFDMKDCLTWDIKYTHMMSIEEFIKNKQPKIDNLVMSAYDPVEEERKRKASANKAANFAKIVEWVKNNTDKKTDKEINELALHILQKRY